MALPPSPGSRPRRRYRCAGLLGFVLAVVLLRLPLKRSVDLVGRLKRGVARSATVEEAEAVVGAVRRAAHWFPGRAACLENSLAAALACLFTGRSVDWCIGARLMPYAAHAWIEVGGVPVGEPSEPDRPYLLLQRT
ncbi:lasso peptide biosynthesis B2 protein [Nocardiopsis quinghaiensis]|uniref:lasso peptide biosynthesis B2 protein n=1 Tax=Nocardiopsis quinghaiensis TaxID=464995 RepID=UPI001CC26C71|nr:lasso peptide biosynthesis B2 protein [Nocardiopsis quinghaiensis]